MIKTFLLKLPHPPKPRFFRSFLIVALATILPLSSISPAVFALPDSSQLDEFAQNSIFFYDPTESNCASSNTTTAGNSDGSDVYIIGDSITVNSKSQILDKLPKATIDAISGTYFSENSSFGPGGTERISNMGSQDILVFAMGTNGGINYTHPDDTAKLFAALQGKNVQVILMTIYYNGKAAEQMENSNTVVKKLVSDYENITYMNWYVTAAADPSSYIGSDGVHPTAAGSEKFAEVMAAVVNKVTKMVTTTGTTAISGDINSSSSSSGLSDLRIQFLEQYHDIAEKLSIEYGIPWEAVMAQGIVESAAGTSYFAKDRNNFFGIGAFDSNPNNAFHYDTPEEGWKGYYENIRKTSVYRAVGAFSGDRITDPYAYIAAIADKYATGPQYANTLSKIIKQIETLSKEEGWASSAELAATHPEMLSNAATNAQGAGSEPSTDYGVVPYCGDTTASQSGDGDQPIAPLYESSVDIACDARTTDLGTDTGYHVNGRRPNYTSFQIRLCALDQPGYQIKGNDYGTGHNTGGYAIVNSRVSGAYAALAHRYNTETGNILVSNTSFRNMAYQTQLYHKMGYPAADYPGCSRHQGGLAIDFSGTYSNWNSTLSKWFKANLGAFGLDRPLSSESWHVEPSSSIEH